MKDLFDVWEFDFPIKRNHPVIVISPPDRAAKAKTINVLFCTSQRQSRKPYPFEVMLDSADGMDWETFCNCAVLYLVPSKDLFGKRGLVSLERRRAIRGMVRDMFLLAATD